MSTSIITAIIGVAGVIIGTLLRWWLWWRSKQREAERSRPYDKMAAAFKLGFYSVELTYLSEWKDIESVSKLFNADLKKCHSLARSIGIEFPPYQFGMEEKDLFRPLHTAIDTLNTQIGSCFKAGMHCGIAFYWRFSIAASLKSSGRLSANELAMANQILNMIDDDIHEAEREFKSAGLSEKLLKPVALYLKKLRKNVLTPKDIGQSGDIMVSLINKIAGQIEARRYM